MSRLNGKASQVLDACLVNESPEVRAKVYEIINLSGLEADDPMFLILILTGQMRVFLEAAPTELSKLLTEWKKFNARSLEEINNAISAIKETQRLQADIIAENLKTISSQCADDIKEAGMAATSAIAEANNETIVKAQQACIEARELKEKLISLLATVEADRQKNEMVSIGLLKRIGQTTKELNQTIIAIDNAGAVVERVQRDALRFGLTNWFPPMLALAIVGAIGFGTGWWSMRLKYNDPNNVLGRNLMGWNMDRLVKCQKDDNPKCTFWIVPPELRE